ncbi:hypothetical protein HMPREF9970_1661 [Lachnoanaerobaculum saburreum F0468]|jgi:hypothetical protein|uniref:Uncharacterized protein n=1 Tax=Lachnoanaerobaculum saburreum F0468 TaxID=1095750 RepID=I0R9N8_9FIRM|nr:hypothetical protein [Lachnoanaerobaculum saburreum]EIC96396.1 hypothetical protein HMPREF9970_1661 [Lachnoanaerobaculum saburreum F0468]
MKRLDNVISDDFECEKGGNNMSSWKEDLLKQIVVVVLEYITEGIKNK